MLNILLPILEGSFSQITGMGNFLTDDTQPWPWALSLVHHQPHFHQIMSDLTGITCCFIGPFHINVRSAELSSILIKSSQSPLRRSLSSFRTLMGSMMSCLSSKSASRFGLKPHHRKHFTMISFCDYALCMVGLIKLNIDPCHQVLLLERLHLTWWYPSWMAAKFCSHLLGQELSLKFENNRLLACIRTLFRS